MDKDVEGLGQTCVEDRAVAWIRSHFSIVAIVAITLIGIAMRLSLRYFESADYQVWLSEWYDAIRENGGLMGLSQQVGDYNVLYQFLIACMTYVPIHKLYAYKLLSCVFDFLLAFVAGKLAQEIWGGDSKRPFVLAYGLVLLSPIVVLNSSAWAQCDSIWTSLCLATVLLLLRKRPVLAFVAYGLAWSFKLQSVLLVPFLLYLWLADRSFSLLHFLEVPAVMLATALPAIVQGTSPLEVFAIYANQTNSYPFIYANYPSIWAVLVRVSQEERAMLDPYLGKWMICTAAGALGMEIYVLCKRDGGQPSKEALLSAGALLTYTAVSLLPEMHDRYAYLAEVMLIVLVVCNVRYAPVAVVAHLLSLMTYGNFLFGSGGLDWRVLGVVSAANLVILCAIVLGGHDARRGPGRHALAPGMTRAR